MPIGLIVSEEWATSVIFRHLGSGIPKQVVSGGCHASVSDEALKSGENHDGGA